MPSIMRHINIVARCSNMFKANKSKERKSDLNAGHYSYILILCRHPGMSQDALAKRICINKSNVTRHLMQLEARGYVERRQSETDKRVTMVYPTEKAFDALAPVRETLAEWNKYITAGFSEEELEMLSEMLSRIARRAAEYAARDLDGEELGE